MEQRIQDKGTHVKRIGRGAAYGTFWKSGFFVRHFMFDSMEDYLVYLQEAPLQPVFAEAPASTMGSYEFTETNSFEEAVSLARFGWHEDFNKLVALVERIKRALDLNLDPRRTFHDYVGFAPDVKAYLEGSPISMINKPPTKRRPLVLYMNTSHDGSMTAEKIYHRGAAVLGCVEALELLGFSVELKLFEMSFLEEEVHFSEFAMKAEDERLNLQKFYFPLCHPSWVRRLNFRLIETSPGLGVGWAGSYGIPADRKLMTGVVETDPSVILIPTIEELGIEGIDILEDVSKLFAEINPYLPADKQLAFR